MNALASMTGFARIDGQNAACRWTWEARSVNGRGLDIRLRAPGFVDQADRVLRQEAAARFKRGSIQATLTVDRAETRQAARIDHQALGALLEDLTRVELPDGAPVA
ncbi:MAG: YicC/YloC family endoribonuclease, partial [Alphaproteobacteria bacterium]